MELKRRLIHRSFLARFLGAAAMGSAMLVAADTAAAFALGNPGMSTPSPAPAPQGTPPKDSKKPKADDEDHHKNRDPNWDVLEGLGGLNVGGPGRRPSPYLPADPTGAGTAGDEAAANDAVAAAARARASRPNSNIDMPDAMRAERCENNRRRIAELEQLIGSFETYFFAIKIAENRSEELFRDLPASSAQYAVALAEVKELKTGMAQLGDMADLERQLTAHRNNLIALDCP